MALGHVCALVTTALPTFTPIHTRSLSQDKNREGRRRKKKIEKKNNRAFSTCVYLQNLFFFLLQALQLSTGLQTQLLVPATSQAPAPGHLPDKKSLQSLFCSAINVTARQLHWKNIDGKKRQHFTAANTRITIYTHGSSYIVSKKKKKATFLTLNSTKNTAIPLE